VGGTAVAVGIDAGILVGREAGVEIGPPVTFEKPHPIIPNTRITTKMKSMSPLGSLLPNRLLKNGKEVIEWRFLRIETTK